MASREEMSTSFGSAAGVYESGRPEYPLEAVAWLLESVTGPDHRARVADVGAGTGKLTRALVELGAETVAIDPDHAMLVALSTAVHGVPTFVGTGERMPLPAESVDAVVFGQAWHWVDAATASLEVARVLRPEGVLGLIWNVRDERVEWVRRLTEIMHGSAAEAMIAEGGPEPHPPFTGFEQRTWGWKRPLTRAAFLDMVASRSYIITAAADERDRILGEVGMLFDEIGGARDAVDLPYRTEAFRGMRP
ncbi:class I SAM-dependent methyltransferase [Microbacterium sp. NPDC019599]|uniref:class I SAM-dependent methyltransferase n=1 Tax=Microbacterium sp. NPDC019599 TaxID=3154690 RepID=UPI0033C75E7F